jgi:hypothetical protein
MDPNILEIPNIQTLHKEKEIKENSKITIFTLVLNKCIQKIIYANKHTDQTFIIFEVPNILIGFPNYDYKSCIIFLMKELSKKQYKVDYMSPWFLRIDWGSPVKSKNTNIYKNLDNIQDYIKVNNPDKLKQQTKSLLKNYPNTNKIVFEYASSSNSKKNKKK